MILHEKQREVILSHAKFKIIRSGRRSGKTSLEIEDMSFSAVSKKDRNIFYLAPTQKQAREIVWELFKKRLSGIGEFNEQRLEIKVPTTDGGFSLIILAGWENRENFRGKSAYKIVFDEVDTMRGFFTGWQEIFRPALMDTGGYAVFIGTPKKENRNLARLEKQAESDSDYAVFHFSSNDNPHIPEVEKEKAKKQMDFDTYRQEILAEYVDNQGSLFKYSALVDVFTNTITKTNSKYLIVDIADDGSDKTVFSRWEGMEEVEREEYDQLNTELIVNKIREVAAKHQIPYSNIAVDAIGVGAGVASSSMLTGIVGYKSSYAPIKTDDNIVHIDRIGHLAQNLVSDFKNLRSQCIFTLADFINTHQIASKVQGEMREKTIEELTLYQDASQGDGKRMATQKDQVKEVLGRSPDHSDTWIMRVYFEIMKKVSPIQNDQRREVAEKQRAQFDRVFNNLGNTR
jgi:hypothetical protein